MAAAIPLVAAIATSASTIAVVGAAIGAVGAISGSKDLAKLGGLIGLAGGVMSMANASGAFAGAGAEAAASGVADAAVGAAEGSWSAADIAQGGGSFTDPSAALAGADAAGNAVDAATNVTGGAENATNFNADMSDYMTANDGNPSLARTELNAAKAVKPPGGESKGLLDSVKDFFKGDHAKAAALQVGGRFLGGLFNKTDQELIQLKEREANNQDALVAIKQEQDRRTGASANFVPTTIASPVNENVNLYPNGRPGDYRMGLVGGQMRRA